MHAPRHTGGRLACRGGHHPATSPHGARVGPGVSRRRVVHDIGRLCRAAAEGVCEAWRMYPVQAERGVDDVLAALAILVGAGIPGCQVFLVVALPLPVSHRFHTGSGRDGMAASLRVRVGLREPSGVPPKPPAGGARAIEISRNGARSGTVIQKSSDEGVTTIAVCALDAGDRNHRTA